MMRAGKAKALISAAARLGLCALAGGIYTFLARDQGPMVARSAEFVVAYFGLLLGLVIAVVSLLSPVFERLAEKVSEGRRRGKPVYVQVLTPARLLRLLRELRRDTLLMLGCFVETVAKPDDSRPPAAVR